MEEEYEDTTLSISQRAYLNGKLQNEIRAGISLMFMILIGYISAFLIYAYANGQDTLNVEDVLFAISIPCVGVIYYAFRSRKLNKGQEEWNENYSTTIVYPSFWYNRAFWCYYWRKDIEFSQSSVSRTKI